MSERTSKCYLCGKEKPLHEFYPDRSRATWVSSKCIKCVKSLRGNPPPRIRR